jgi:CheY-like chemotaxis protein
VSDSDAALLVVDDIEDNRFALTRRLAGQGYLNVTTAADGRQALELLKSKPYDLVLLDIMMPNVNGYEVLAQMKANESLRHVPVIMISAVDDIDSVIRCIEPGAEDYLPKPFNLTLLRAASVPAWGVNGFTTRSRRARERACRGAGAADGDVRGSSGHLQLAGRIGACVPCHAFKRGTSLRGQIRRAFSLQRQCISCGCHARRAARIRRVSRARVIPT